ncbi:MAG: hypothetical protein ACETWC_07080 [Acidobacteriota bacterium]
MGMIIRVAFNKEEWSGRCKNAKSDKRLFKCRKKAVDTGYKVVDIDCLSEDCWEQTLCTDSGYWMSRGNFDRNRAIGNVFFVYQAVNKDYVLWGKSKVKSVEGDEISFEPFKPMPQEKEVSGLSAKKLAELAGVKKWGQGTYRYIDAGREIFLNDLIQREN